MIWKNKFHERINELWKRAKDQDHRMTQVEYAKRFGVTRNALLGWLRGSGQPDADGFVRIAGIEKVSLGWLLGDERIAGDDGSFLEEQEMLQLFRDISPEHQEDLLALARRFQARDR